jgi:hypothetical protein
VIIPSVANADGPWYLFDSHSRPQLGLNGGFITSCTSVQDLINNLRAIFPVVNLDEDMDGGSLMAEMYNSVEAVPMQLQK